MAKKMKKLLSFVLVLSMVLGMGAIGAFADETTPAGGTDGNTTAADSQTTGGTEAGADKTDADKTDADKTTGSAVTAPEQSAFTDVKTDDWFFAAVMWCYNNKLMSGTGTGIFEPDTLTTRAMLVTTLYNMEGKPSVTTSGTFGDVASGSWYGAAVEWAAANNIVSGYNGKFAPEAALTREDLVTIIHKYVAFKKADVSARADLAAYTDNASISEYAQDSVKWAVAANVVTGLTKTTIGPKETATRAQLAMILYKLRTTILADIEDEDTPLAALPDLPGVSGGSTGGSGGGGGGGGRPSTPATTTVTLVAGEGAVFTAPAGWTLNADGTYTASGNLNAAAIEAALAGASVTRTGYTFAGWTVTGTTATANWTRNTQSVTVDLAGGALASAPEGWTLNEDGTYTVVVNEGDAVDFTDVVPTREGYTFVNFVDNTAQWVRNTESVTVDLAGGELASTPEGWTLNEDGTYTVVVNEGDAVDFTGVELTREGYTFAGWTTEGTTATANWDLIVTIVGLELGDGVMVRLPETWMLNEDGTYSLAGTLTDAEVLATLEGTTPARLGYVFTRWTIADGVVTPKWGMGTIVDLDGGTLETVPEDWADNGDGTYTVVIEEGADFDLSDITPTKEGFVFKGFENNTAQWEKEETAKSVTEDAVKKVQAVLEGITGHGGAPLVTVEGEDGAYAVTLDTDAIMAGEGAFDDDLLNGLATKIGEALKEQFAGYTISVNDKIVYDENGSFNNTNLKEALYDVASGFFYQLANMTPDNGVYTYKTVSAAVTNADDSADAYALEASINLKGEDVAKVQSLASVLEKHLAMKTMTAAEADAAFGAAMADVPAENEYIVVEAEMPEKVINTVKEMFSGLTPEQIQEKFDIQDVNMALSALGAVSIDDIVGSGASEIETIVNMIDSNANLINKVLDKVELKIKGETFISGDFNMTGDGDAWQRLVAGIHSMVGQEILDSAIGSYRVDGTTKYLVPVTVKINLENALGFTATETVLVVMNIDFGTDEPVIPEQSKAEEITATVITTVQDALAEITGHDGAPIVELTEADGAYAMTLNADAIQADGAVFTDDMLTGLATKVGEALKDFEGYTVSVADTVVVNADGSINNTGLKNAIYEVAQGFFYKLSNMTAEDGIYTYGEPIQIAVANEADGKDAYETEIAVQLSGVDVERVVELASTLEKHLAMTTMTAAEADAAFGAAMTDVPAENEYIVVEAEMPEKMINTVKEMFSGLTSEQIQEKFDIQNVDFALSALGAVSIDDIVSSGASGIETIVNMIDSNANLINKVLDKVELTIKGETFISGDFDMTGDGDAWQRLVAGIHSMVGQEILDSTIGSYRVGDTTEYLVPVTVKIDLEKSLGFTATETVLVVMNIAF